MNPLLSSWYNDISIDVSASTLQARTVALESVEGELDREGLASLVALAYGLPEAGQYQWFREAFQEVDAAFLMRGNERELAVLAGACVMGVCELGNEMSVLAAASSAVAARRGLPSVFPELPMVAEQTLLDLSVARRRVEAPPTSTTVQVWNKATLAGINTLVEGQGVTDTNLIASLEKLAQSVTSAMQHAAANYTRLAEWTERSISTYAEEGQLLSWLLSGRSSTLDVPWTSTDRETAAILSAREVVTLSVMLPPPPQADAMLEQMLASVRFSKRETSTVLPERDIPPALAPICETGRTATVALDLAHLSLREAVMLAAWDGLE